MKLIKQSHEILTITEYPNMLIEKAGRICYQSKKSSLYENRRKFIENIIKKEHFSVLEHVNITIRIITNRYISHELIRHRLVSYSQESTRYCNYKDGLTFIVPSWIDINIGNYDNKYQELEFFKISKDKIWANSLLQIEINYKKLLKSGWSSQQAHDILPSALKTELIMTANVREWRHILKLRTSPKAHPLMRELMLGIQKDLKEKLDILF